MVENEQDCSWESFKPAPQPSTCNIVPSLAKEKKTSQFQCAIVAMTSHLTGFRNKEAAFGEMKDKLGVNPNSDIHRLTVATTLLVIDNDKLGLGQKKTGKERKAIKQKIICSE